MNKPKILILIFILGFFSFLWQSNSVLACAQSSYSLIESPEDFDTLSDPLDFFTGEQFMAGDYGIIGPSWASMYLYKVYLDLTDVKLTPEMSNVLLDFLSFNDIGYNSGGLSSLARAEWHKSAKNVLGDGFRGNEQRLCPESAYLTAIETLEKRKTIYTQEQLKMWIEGQEKVFENCQDISMGKNQLPGVEIVLDAPNNKHAAFIGRITSFFNSFFEKARGAIKGIPKFFASLFSKRGQNKIASSDQTANKVFAFDTQYQTAATAFYKNDLDLSESLFIAITENNEHIWRPQAFLVLGRIYILKAKEARLNCENKCQSDRDNCCSPWDGRDEILTMDKYKAYRAYLIKAKQQFERILSDDQLNEARDGATLLLNYCNYRLDPKQHLKDIQTLLKNPQANFLQIYLNDLLWLLPEFSIKENADVLDDLSLWLKAWRGEGDKNFIFSQYQKTKSLPWLLISLRIISKEDSEADQIIAQSYQIQEDSPAFWTAVYLRNKFFIESSDRNKVEKAQKEIRDLLTNVKATGDIILEGYFNGLLIRTTDNIAEASKYALVKVLALKDETFGYVEKQKNTQITLLSDFIDYLNTQAPSADWSRALDNIKELPADFKDYILLTAFARNLLLGDFIMAQNSAQLFMSQSQQNQIKPYLQGFLSSISDDEKRFSGLFFLLHYPLLGYNIKQDLLAEDSSNWDSFGDNFWRSCNGQIAADNIFNKFAQDSSLAVEENKKICALEKPAVNYIAKNIIAFSQKYPNDARVPEALSLVVEATRSSYGRDGQTTVYSRQAFQILHNNYPRNVWTEQTPYWY